MADEVQKAKKALIKKALSFKTKEVVEEYSTTEGQVVLVKKKVTEKLVPPDCTAIKMLIEEKRSFGRGLQAVVHRLFFFPPLSVDVFCFLTFSFPFS